MLFMIREKVVEVMFLIQNTLKVIRNPESLNLIPVKVVLNYSALKSFHKYAINSHISVQANCIDSIYTDLRGLVQ